MHAMKKLKDLDKHFKSPEDFARSDPVAEKKAQEDVLTFLAEMNTTDQKLRVNSLEQ